MNVWEQPKLAHAFRVKGQHGVVNFDDFQRICVLTKLHQNKKVGKAVAVSAASSNMNTNDNI